MQIWRDADIDESPLTGKVFGVLGYSRFGRAMALNLRDGGYTVLVAEHPGTPAHERAVTEGFSPRSIRDVVAASDIILLMFGYEEQGRLYHAAVDQHVRSGQTLVVSHGFSIHYQELRPSPLLDVVMVAPRSPSKTLRETYVQGTGVPALVAVHQNPSGRAWEVVMALAKALGCGRAGVMKTTFKEETECDLFGEQVVHGGGLVQLLLTAYEVAVEAGYPPEVAYFECIHEVKMIADLIYEAGFAHTREAISPTAAFGGFRAGKFIIDDHVRENMRRVLRDIQDGTFAREWLQETRAGFPAFERMKWEERQHEAEEVGRCLRALIPWLNAR